MKQTFRNADFDRLANAWNAFAPERYALDAEILRQKTIECPVFDWGASVIEEADGEILAFASVKRSAAGLYRGADQDLAHLSILAFRDPHFGLDLLTDVKQNLRNRGFTKLVLGQDSDHVLPGCPTDFPTLSNFLMVEGFAPTGEVVDLERDLQGYGNPFPVPGDATFRALQSVDLPLLDTFFDREFPGRWKYDTFSKIEREGTHCVFVMLRDGQIDGFALIQDWRNQAPKGGAVWRRSLGDHWGSLGPIGVSEGLRGRGYGNALLGEALAELARRGARQTIIDWTGLVKFYGGHGFVPTRTYECMALAL